MWMNSVKLRVATKDAPDAGTDSLVLAEIFRDGQLTNSLRLDYPDENDLDAGAFRNYYYSNLTRSNDQTKELRDGVVQSPMPYPESGIEFSDGLPGHFGLRLHIRGDDMWIKDSFEFFYREYRDVPDSFDTSVWREDTQWTDLGYWGKDIAMSTDSDEGFTYLNLNM